MRQLQFIARGQLEWREAPDPVLEAPTDAIVRPFAVARCDLDAAFLFHAPGLALRLAAAAHLADPRILDDLGARPFAGPFPYGHECVAEVTAVGADVRERAVGDVVIVPFQVSCGRCLTCRRGLTSHCETDRTTTISAYGFGEATGGWGGAMSDAVRVPHADHMLVPVPAGVDPVALASASDNIPDGWRAVGPYLQERPGAPVLILGGRARSVGLYAAGLAVAMGSERVDYVDTGAERLAIAERLGARAIERPRGRQAWRGIVDVAAGTYPISFDACGEAGALDYAIRALEPGGTCTLASFYFRKGTKLPVWEMYAKSLTFRTGLALPSVHLPDILDLVASGAFDPGLVTTKIAPWADAADAFLEPGAKVVVERARSASVPQRFPEAPDAATASQ
jgi:alcohol dehydrogenase